MSVTAGSGALTLDCLSVMHGITRQRKFDQQPPVSRPAYPLEPPPGRTPFYRCFSAHFPCSILPYFT